MKYYVYAKQIVLDDQVIDKAYLTIEDGKFGPILMEEPQDAPIKDYSNSIVAPGLVDTHIHGYKSHDVMDNDFEGIKVISEGLLSCGVTSWLPTTLTSSAQLLNDVCETIGNHYQEVTGAKIRGIFLEGPFFTEKYKGAQNPKYMSDPSVEKLAKWHELSQGLVNKIAIAPERKGVKEFIEFAKSKGVYTALAHSDATYEEAAAAVDAGANIFVHIYNGMSGLHHRNPGMVGAALSLDKVFAEMICDGHHVHPAAARVVTRARGPQETVLITDCMRAGGMGEGQSRLGEFEVVVKDGTARLKDTGNLAGSILELKQGVKNVVDWGLVSPAEALRMASLTPAQSVGIESVCGRIAPGYEADFIVVSDQLELEATYLDGELRYQA
ncbi:MULTISPECIES: N-acetylglucosamine-6-phosphate deacetylase [unclassified Abiotrophia]|jgi:N-acetylglucosamine-6-phosphate deacetylase|uniref:N-acetylglucosamine-6-phosphate deacetylase n=1 Tax=unclassified Abiotrophia TaxID=2608917 RepID=UPI0008A20064|nr:MULTISPECIES: N-acetylglucosamine-6-phosphate deacetylase [unclassified Abiotrophia]MBF0936522.1 N-acetylglucosamine-6-phosphate deacetylase [Abiotrophia sp.]OFS30231.1 N-acetylglucosamine-6-phosphate deacetylase [Abiotrophia sp. HMSC24B09]